MMHPDEFIKSTNAFAYTSIGGTNYVTAPEEFFEYLDDCEYAGVITAEEFMEALDDWIEE
ncbi:MAG: hypothetical protein EBU08_21465 [Micrococcales bacterium]|nr:hypothetical protein [Micrococcales bacterium]